MQYTRLTDNVHCCFCSESIHCNDPRSVTDAVRRRTVLLRRPASFGLS